MSNERRHPATETGRAGHHGSAQGGAAGDAASAGALPDLDTPSAGADGLDLSPEAAIAESLSSALQHLRESADQLEQMPVDEAKVDAAERIAGQAAQLDEQIGSMARKDDH